MRASAVPKPSSSGRVTVNCSTRGACKRCRRADKIVAFTYTQSVSVNTICGEIFCVVAPTPEDWTISPTLSDASVITSSTDCCEAELISSGTDISIWSAGEVGTGGDGGGAGVETGGGDGTGGGGEEGGDETGEGDGRGGESDCDDEAGVGGGAGEGVGGADDESGGGEGGGDDETDAGGD
eukprot:scaffold7516_cov376-Prasinococcus_capsulatus_cf.AAC.5